MNASYVATRRSYFSATMQHSAPLSSLSPSLSLCLCLSDKTHDEMNKRIAAGDRRRDGGRWWQPLRTTVTDASAIARRFLPIVLPPGKSSTTTDRHRTFALPRPPRRPRHLSPDNSTQFTVVRPTVSCFADWSKRRHVTSSVIICSPPPRDIFNLGFVIFPCPTHYRASSVN